MTRWQKAQQILNLETTSNDNDNDDLTQGPPTRRADAADAARRGDARRHRQTDVWAKAESGAVTRDAGGACESILGLCAVFRLS